MPKGQYARKPPPDLVGQRFGWWTVISSSTRRSTRGAAYWVCRCDCSVEREVRAASLRSRVSTSCGCDRSGVEEANTTHGLSRAPEYRIWLAMKQRCENPRTTKWALYGGRGIKVCPRWRDSYEAFIEDMGARPGTQHSVERRGRDGDYEPANCYWASPTQQNRNTSRNRVLTHAGQTLSLAEWAEKVGLPYGALYSRVHTYGWDVERALTTPHRTLSKRTPLPTAEASPA